MILRAKYLITGDGRTCLQDQAVYLDKEGKIGWIGDAAEAAGRYPEEMVKDYGEATILPGLFDMHVHFGYYYSQPDLDNYDDYMVAYYALEQAKQSLRLGITTVRDLSCPPNLMKQLRLAGQKGYVTVPRIIHADAGICMTGGHGHQDGVEEADSPWGVRAAIRRQLRAGADWVKILTSNRGDIPEFTQEELDAAVDEAHRQGVKIAVHSGTQPSIQMCIDAGFDTIEHGTFLTEAQARQMAEKGIAWTPTITAYTYLYEQTKQMIEAGVDQGNLFGMEPETLKNKHVERIPETLGDAIEAYRDNFKKLYDTGVTVLAGSDMVLYKAPPLPIHQELGYMVDYGITPVEAVRTATYNAASVLGIEKETGSLKEGLAGDLLVVKGDVSKNIRALDDVLEVYLAGKMVYTV